MEQRDLERKKLVFYPAVYKKGTRKPLGRVVDINTAGMQLVSDAPLEIGSGFDLRLVMPQYRPEQEPIRFTANSVWCEADVNPEYHCTGMQFTDISDDDVTRIEYLIARSSFPG